MNNSTEALGFETAELPEYIAWTSLVLCSIILFVGILGNLLVIIVILTSKVLRSSTNLFLLNLSIADLLVLAICTSSSLVEIVTRSDKWILGKVHILKPRTSAFFPSYRCTEVCFASFLSGGFTTMAGINTPERKLAKRTTVYCTDPDFGVQQFVLLKLFHLYYQHKWNLQTVATNEFL